MAQEEKIIVSMQDGMSDTKRLNLHITVALLSFMTMVFHFTTVYFFTIQLESLAMVGIFLGLGNFFAFLLDVPIGILQYHLKSKTLYAMGIISQIVSMLIFALFIFSVTDMISELSDNAGVLEGILRLFLTDGVNLILMLVAAFCYGFTKEVNDITTISYVLNNANPNQYKSIFARNNIFFGLGSFLGLFFAGIVLSLQPKVIIFQILFTLILVFFITRKFFDNEDKVITVNDIEQFYLNRENFSLKNTAENVGENITGMVSRINIKDVLAEKKYLILKPKFITGSKINSKELIQKTSVSFKDIYETLRFSLDTHLIVYWAFIMLLTFGFWDTFASTFLIDFLDQLKPGWSFLLLGLIAIPAYGLQDFFGKLSDKIGSFKLSLFGLFLSALSLIVMSFFAGDKNLVLVLVLALVNSIGYSICMSLAVANFLETYNEAYADRKGLTQIDANASAAPMKILQNMANMIGLFLGGIILSIAGFGGFFFVFGVFIGVFLFWSFYNRKKITH